MKHIGILAHSFEGATLCFRTACLEGVAKLGPHMHPEITMAVSPMALVLDAWERGDNEELRAFFMKDAEKLAAAGANFFVLPDNTAHIAMESPGNPFPIPGLNIGEVVAEQAKRDGRSKVGILGTKYTMNGPVYPGALGRRGIGWAVLYRDPRGGNLHNAWVGDHELGQLAGLDILIAMDMWEHAYMVDYTPAEKKLYIDAFFANLNWGVAEDRFASQS